LSTTEEIQRSQRQTVLLSRRVDDKLFQLTAHGTQNFAVPSTSSPSEKLNTSSSADRSHGHHRTSSTGTQSSCRYAVCRSNTMDTLPHEQSDLEGGSLTSASVELVTYGHSTSSWH